jgi:hypothetical protein
MASTGGGHCRAPCWFGCAEPERFEAPFCSRERNGKPIERERGLSKATLERGRLRLGRPQRRGWTLT